MKWRIPNTPFGGNPVAPEDEMDEDDVNARKVQYQIGKLSGYADEDCCPDGNRGGTYGDYNIDYDDETHDAYNRLIDADPLYAAKLSQDLATLAIATHNEQLDTAATSRTGAKIPRTRKSSTSASG